MIDNVILFQLRQFLDTVATQLKNLPSRMRQYAAYEHLQKAIKGHQKVTVFNGLLFAAMSITCPSLVARLSFRFL